MNNLSTGDVSWQRSLLRFFAVLDAERTRAERLNSMLADTSDKEQERAEKAERRLAEAVELLRQIRAERHWWCTRGQVFDGGTYGCSCPAGRRDITIDAFLASFEEETL